MSGHAWWVVGAVGGIVWYCGSIAAVWLHFRGLNALWDEERDAWDGFDFKAQDAARYEIERRSRRAWRIPLSALLSMFPLAFCVAKAVTS